MILPFVFVLLCARLAESEFAGDACTLSTGSSGVCMSVYVCKSVYDEVVAGGLPDKVCGYNGDEPIVCCPNAVPTTEVTVKPTATSKTRMEISGDGRGAISKKKCAYYSQFVYTLKYPPFGDRTPISVSQCAIQSQKLISGGTKAERMEFPHMTALGYNKPDGDITWLCGGTLISEEYVLTAAHCTYSADYGDVAWARLGDLNLAKSVDDGATPVTLRIVDLIRYPEYKPPVEYHDIALLRLEKKVTFNGWIRPACLHTAADTGTSKAIATGWGRVDWIDKEGSENLLKVTMALVDSKTCHDKWISSGTDYKLPNGILADISICAGEDKKDTCQGDSGGPLVVFSDKKFDCMYDVVGVTSVGRLCGVNFPGVYTRVYNYVSWIESIVWPQG